MRCPRCSGKLIYETPMALKHIKAVRCLTCGFWHEDGMTDNRLHHEAWVKEDNPRAGIVKERNYVTR